MPESTGWTYWRSPSCPSAGLKLAKIAVKMVKALKLAKSGLKAFKKARDKS